MAIANSDGSIVLSTKLDTSGVARAIDALKKKIDSVKDKKAAIQQLTQAIKDQQYVIKQLEIEYGMLVAKGQGNTEQAEELKARIKALKDELNQLGGAATTMGAKTAAASTKAAQGLAKFGKRIVSIMKSVLVFSVIYKVMQAVVKLFGNILMSDEEFKQDWEELKAAFYTAAYPIVNLIAPAVKYIAQQVRDWAISIGKVAAALQGMTYKELVNQAQASKEAADNYEDMEKSSKKTADNVKKQLASFDDIQILSTGSKEETGYEGFEALGQYDTSGEKSMLVDLMKTIGGALTAVGIILLFKGHVAWGIGFIVAGAASWAIGEIWGEDYDSNSAIDILNNIMQTIGVSLAAVGIILLTKGNIQWGIAFLVAGAAFWGIEYFSTTEFSTDPIVNTLIKIMGIVGTALLAIGIILCVFGVVNPVSIGLIVAGAASLAAAVGLSQEAVVEAIRGPIGAIMAIVSAALLVLGIILCCCGIITPATIGLIIAGAAGLATVVAVNWNAIVDWVKGAWETIKQWIATYGGLVLGIILLFTGVGAPLGMALILDSVGALGKGEKPLLWDGILNSIKKTWSDIKAYWNANIANVWTLKFWLDLAKIAGNGLISGFELAINGIITMFENMINFAVDGINSISFDIPDWLGGGTFGMNLPRASLGRVSIPRLAQGAVIPPNKEFLAVLGDQRQGTNIETPLATMVEAFQMALDSRQNSTTKEEHYYLNETELMSIMYRLVKGGERISGTNLASGGVF